jgi:hypothetical protein
MKVSIVSENEEVDERKGMLNRLDNMKNEVS